MDCISMRQTGGIAVEGNFSETAVIELYTGAVSPDFVGGQSAGKIQMRIDRGLHVQPKPAGVNDIVVCIVDVG